MHLRQLEDSAGDRPCGGESDIKVLRGRLLSGAIPGLHRRSVRLLVGPTGLAGGLSDTTGSIRSSVHGQCLPPDAAITIEVHIDHYRARCAKLIS